MKISRGDWLIFMANRRERTYSEVIRKPRPRPRTILTTDGLVATAMVVGVETSREAARRNVNEFNQGAKT